jgi:hypothetical protein
MAAPKKPDLFGPLKPLVVDAQKLPRMNMSKLLKLGDCFKGRRSILDWLDGVPNTEPRVFTGLRRNYATALIAALRKVHADSTPEVRNAWLARVDKAVVDCENLARGPSVPVESDPWIAYYEESSRLHEMAQKMLDAGKIKEGESISGVNGAKVTIRRWGTILTHVDDEDDAFSPPGIDPKRG